MRFIEMMPIGLGKEFTARRGTDKGCSGEGIRVNDTDGRETWKWHIIIIPWRSLQAGSDLSVLCPTNSVTAATG